MRTELESNGTIALERSRIADYLTLTKPELTFLSVVTAVGGFYLGVTGAIPIDLLLHTLFGTAFVGGGAGTLNQYLERHYDALMRRTENRPLPAGRLTPAEVLVFGTLLAIAGIVQLTLLVNPLSGLLAVVTLGTYLFLYTPLKRLTWISTVVGGIPGALPPMIGWTAARNEVTIEAWILFGILFFWQMPHFFSLAWMYRRDYERAGYPMLTVLDHQGVRTARQILYYCVGIIPVSILLFWFADLGVVYLFGALVSGGGFLYFGWRLHLVKSNAAARQLFFASLLYLPLLLAFMVLDKI